MGWSTVDRGIRVKGKSIKYPLEVSSETTRKGEAGGALITWWIGALVCDSCWLLARRRGIMGPIFLCAGHLSEGIFSRALIVLVLQGAVISMRRSRRDGNHLVVERCRDYLTHTHTLTHSVECELRVFFKCRVFSPGSRQINVRVTHQEMVSSSSQQHCVWLVAFFLSLFSGAHLLSLL